MNKNKTQITIISRETPAQSETSRWSGSACAKAENLLFLAENNRNNKFTMISSRPNT